MPIENLSFPHIVDLIWSYMELPVVFVAGKTCSAWRKRANRILQRHLVAQPELVGSGIRLFVKSFERPGRTLSLFYFPLDLMKKLRDCPDYDIPIYPHYFIPHDVVKKLEGLRPPSDSEPEDSTSAPPDPDIAAPLMELFKNIRVLDLCHWRKSDSYRRGIRRTRDNKQADIEAVVIVLAQRFSLEVTRTFVDRRDFGTSLGEAETAVYFGGEGMDNICSPSAKRAVVHVRPFDDDWNPLYGRGDVPLGFVLDEDRDCPVEELIIVYSGAFGYMADEDERYFGPSAYAQQYKPYLIDYYKHYPLTLVGLETLFKSREEFVKFKACLLEIAHAEPGEAGDRLRILAHEEYRALVGNDTYDLHLKE